jgi:hypothetical protein
MSVSDPGSPCVTTTPTGSTPGGTGGEVLRAGIFFALGAVVVLSVGVAIAAVVELERNRRR